MAVDVRAFREALEEFLLLHVTVPTPFGYVEFPRDDADRAEIDRLRAKVSTLSGRAQIGVTTAGMAYAVEGARDAVNPAAAWLTITQPKPLLGREDVLSAAYAAEGYLERQQEMARQVERSLAGRLAALIGWPRRVRDLAFPNGGRAAAVTQWTVGGIMFALVTGVAASIIYAMLQSLGA